MPATPDPAGRPHKIPSPVGRPPTPGIPDYLQAMARLPDMSALQVPKSLVVESIEANYASQFYRRLSKWIIDFEATLDEQHEVGVRLVSFGQTVVFHLEKIGFWNPSLIRFFGRTDGGNQVELIQHVSQISILLMKLPRQNPEKPARRIGFHADDGQQDSPEA